MIERHLRVIRGDQNETTRFLFAHGRASADVVQARFYVRSDVPRPRRGDLLVKVTLAERPSDWEIGDDTAAVTLRASDTQALDEGKFVYDVEFVFTDDSVVTVQGGAFTVQGDVATDVASDSLPVLEFGVTEAQRCALDGAATADCDNPLATMADVATAGTAALNPLAEFLLLPQLRGLWPMSSVDQAGTVYDLSGQGRAMTAVGGMTYDLTAENAPYANFADGYLTRPGDEAGLEDTSVSFGGWFWLNAPLLSAVLIDKYVYQLSATVAVCCGDN